MSPTTAKKSGGKRPPVAPKRSNTAVIVVIAVALVAVIGLGVGVATQLGKGSDNLSQTQPVRVVGTPLSADTDATPDPVVGTVPPMLDGKSFDGSRLTIDPADGSPKLVMFIAHWCPHCQAEVPRIVQWQKEGKVPAGIEVYGVATGTNSSRDNYPPSSWLDREGWPFKTMADSSDDVAAQAWGLNAYPYFVTLDKDGKVVTRASGELTEADFTALVGQIAPST